MVARKKICDYLFLSPIYDSISKDSYPSHFSPAQLREMADRKIIDKKVMALGGIDLDRIAQMRDYGFGGVVILGAIWNRFDIHQTSDFKELIHHFRKLRKAAN